MGKKAFRLEKYEADQAARSLQNPDLVCRLSALGKLGDLGAAAAPHVAALAHCLDEREDILIRRAAAEALRSLSDVSSPVSSTLASHVFDKDPLLSDLCFQALRIARAPTASHVAELARILDEGRIPECHDAAQFRMLNIEAIGKVGPEAASHVSVLAKHLFDPDISVSGMALLALSKVGAPAAPHLVKVAQLLPGLPHRLGPKRSLMYPFQSGSLRAAAVTILDLAGPDAQPYAVMLANNLTDSVLESGSQLSTGDLVTKLLSKQAFGAAGADAAAPFLDDPDKLVRLRAVRIVAASGVATVPHMAALARRLDDSEFNIRCVAVRTLGRLGHEAVPHSLGLVRCLQHDGFWSIRLDAARALGSMGREAAPHAAAALVLAAEQDCNAQVRRAAEAARFEIERPMRIVAIHESTLCSDGSFTITCTNLGGGHLSTISIAPIEPVKKLKELLAQQLQEPFEHLRLVTLGATILQDEQPVWAIHDE